MKTLTYGTLLSREEFDEAFERGGPEADGKIFHKAPYGRSTFHFVNDPRVGTCELTCSELWGEITKAQEESACDCDISAHRAAGQWCSDVLGVLGFEWV